MCDYKLKLANAWIAHATAPRDLADKEGHYSFCENEKSCSCASCANKWSYSELAGYTESNIALAFELILLILKMTDDELVIGLVGTGPIENMLNLHQAEALKLIESEVVGNKNHKLKIALSSVYYYDFTNEIISKIERIIDF